MIRQAVLNTLRQIGAIPDPDDRSSQVEVGAGSDANLHDKPSDPALPTAMWLDDYDEWSSSDIYAHTMRQMREDRREK